MGDKWKYAVLTLATAVVIAVAMDFLSAYFLFFYQKSFGAEDVWAPGKHRYVAYENGATPALSIAATLIDRLRPTTTPASQSDDGADPGAHPKVLIHPHETLGWAAQPGIHRLVFGWPKEASSQYPRRHDWTATIYSDGSRATSRQAINATRHMFVLGDSWIFGWALDDEFTLGWLLQSEYRKRYAVRVYANGGWAHTHALINFRRLAPSLNAEDILIVGYAQFLLPRNAPQPSVVASLATGLAQYAEGPDRPLRYPHASTSQKGISLDMLPLDCNLAGGYCAQDDVSLETLERITIALFDEIIDTSPAKLLVLQMDGPDDAVVAHLRRRGVTIVDGRPTPGTFTKDTMMPYDAHPGPITHHHWFSQLRPVLDAMIAD